MADKVTSDKDARHSVSQLLLAKASEVDLSLTPSNESAMNWRREAADLVRERLGEVACGQFCNPPTDPNVHDRGRLNDFLRTHQIWLREKADALTEPERNPTPAAPEVIDVDANVETAPVDPDALTAV